MDYDPSAAVQIRVIAALPAFALLFLSMQLLPAAVSQTFVAALPVVIMPFTIILYKEHVSRRALLGALVAMAGVTLLFVTPNRSNGSEPCCPSPSVTTRYGNASESRVHASSSLAIDY